MFYALSLLMVPSFFSKIKEQTQVTTKKAGFLILSNKILAGVSAILILKATDLGDVAVVQAIGGVQFVFVLLFGMLICYVPRLNLCPQEKYDRSVILQKALFVAVISIGFLVLFT